MVWGHISTSPNIQVNILYSSQYLTFIVELAAVTMIMSRRSGGEEGALAREVHVVAQENG